jgi:hypothetical protein
LPAITACTDQRRDGFRAVAQACALRKTAELRLRISARALPTTRAPPVNLCGLCGVDPMRGRASPFISGLSQDEQVDLVALA